MSRAKAVLDKVDAEKIAVAYSPRRFPATISNVAHDFVAFNSGNSSSFRIDRLVAEQTGVAELERLSIEEKVEREALLRLKDLQEQAYQQAYQLGLDQGREKAFLDQQTELNEKLLHLEELLNSIDRLKGDLIACNETQIVRLIFYMSKRLVLQEIEVKPELILEVVRQAVMGAQSDEKVTVRVSPSDFTFIESIKEKLGKDFDAVKRAKLDSSEDIMPGGCVVETNYGDVDATIDQRLDKLWSSISEKLPKVKNVVGTTGNQEG
jgi:flagellar assembly protein FliH